MTITNLLAQGAAWLAQQQARHAASWVYYARGTAAVRVAAMRGRSTFDVTDSEGMMSSMETSDFIVSTSDLVLDDIPITPAAGDRITVGELGEGQVYEVMSVPGGDCWRYSDEHHLQIRVHGKFVENQGD